MSVNIFFSSSWQGQAPGLNKGLNSRTTRLNGLSQGLSNLASTNQIYGNGADNMKAYISEVHLNLIETLITAVTTFQTALAVYWNGYHQVDASGDFKLINEDFRAHVQDTKNAIHHMDGFENHIRQVASSVNHIVSLGDAGAGAIANVRHDLEDMQRIAREQADRWSHYENCDPGLNQVEEMIATIKGLLNEIGNISVGRSYTKGGFFNLSGYATLSNLSAQMGAYNKKNSGAITDWMNQLDSKTKKVQNENLEKEAKRLGIPVEVLMEMYRSFQKEYGKNSYYSKNFVAILKLMKPGALTQGKFSTYGIHGQKTFNYLMQDWRAIKKYLKGLDTPAAQKLLSQMDGSFNQFLKNVEKLKDFKGVAKYTKPLGEAAGWVTNVTKKGVGKLGTKLTKLKPLGKLAGKVGWSAMAVDVGYDVYTSYNDKNSSDYHNFDKAVIHAGVGQLKSAGPLEGALAGGAVGGPIGAGIGFVAGTGNAIWGALDPKGKDKFYGAIEKGADWLIDKRDDVKNSIKKGIQSTWKNVTSFFGGKKNA